MSETLITLQFPPSAAAQFVDYVKSLKKNPYRDWRDIRYAVANELFESLGKAAKEFPDSDAQRILDIFDKAQKNHKLPVGILIKNFPVDAKEDLLNPPNQQHYDSDKPEDRGKKTYIAEFAMLALNTAMGMDMAINPDLQDGWPYQHVTPKEGKRDTASHAGTAVFPRHSDGAHLPDDKLVDWVGLHTLRNGKTQSILVDYTALEKALHNRLGDDFAVLTEPRFRFSSSAAYDGVKSLTAPILTCWENGEKIWRAQGNRELITAATPDDTKAQEVLDIFLDVLENVAPAHQFALEYGDALFIDNLRGFVHTRSRIETENHPDDAKRHLLRSHGRFSAEVIERAKTTDPRGKFS